ncbi:MAG: DUF1302 family protein [Candidatus Omnitrophota bacterium]|nr:MAG: DUF1302 family protein [Candidatus Omnitrophota bacterium]
MVEEQKRKNGKRNLRGCKMRKILFLLFIFPLSVFAGQIGDDVEYSGYIKNEVWFRTNTDTSHQFLTSFKNTFDIGIEYKINDDWTFFFHPRYFYDFAYDIRDDDVFDRNQEIMGHTYQDEWLRDCYFDYISDNLDLRLGKQQVVWGQMDVPILDRVMPIDLTNWFLPDLADMRIPLWMVKLEYSPWVNSTIQALFIPDFEASRVAPPGAPFSFAAYNAFYDLQQSLPQIVDPGPPPVYLNNIFVDSKTPPGQFENSTFGLRWRSMIEDLEYTLNWLYGYSTSAYLYTDPTVSVFSIFPPPPPGEVNSDGYRSRRHKRIQMAGFSFAKTLVNPGPFEGLTLKGEFAYIHDEPTYYGTSGSREMTRASDKYNWGFALEKNIVTNWLVNFQFLQFIADRRTMIDPSTGISYRILDTSTYGVIDKIENVYVVKIMTDFMHERLKPEITIVYQDDNQGRIVPKVVYELRDNIWLKLGYAHFFGRPDSSNGQFRNRDLLMFEVKYTF